MKRPSTRSVVEFLVICVAVFGLGLTRAAAQLNLTGTWEGKMKCKLYDGGTTLQVLYLDDIEVTQTGANLNISIPSLGWTYNGEVIENSNKAGKGDAAVIGCGSVPDLSTATTLGVAKVGVSNKGKGRFKMVQTVWDGLGAVGYCKWSYKLANPEDPLVPPCS